MPAHVLDQANATTAGLFAVVGTYPDGGGPFVSHASLLRVAAALTGGAYAGVYHMRPPLDLGTVGGNTTHNIHPYARAHVIGFLENLTEEETAGMRSWIERLARQMPAIPAAREWRDRFLSHYTMWPHVQPGVTDQTTGTPRHFRYSCVGLVLECYGQGAGIRLLAWDSPDFPCVSLAQLIRIYTDQTILAPNNLVKVGLTGTGPWPIALAGYLFHSLLRTPEEVRQTPYLPSLAEVDFPLPVPPVPAPQPPTAA